MSNNNDEDGNNGKRKVRSYLAADDFQNGPNKRLNAPQPPNAPVMAPIQRISTPVMAPPTMPGFGFGNPQMANPAVDAPQQATTSDPAAVCSTGLRLQYPQPQSLSQSQFQYTQQQSQHRPLMSNPTPPPIPASLPSNTQDVVIKMEGPRRQRLGKAPAQDQAQFTPPAPILSKSTPGPTTNCLSSNSTDDLSLTETGGEGQEPGMVGSASEQQQDTPQESVSSRNASSSVRHGQKVPSAELVKHQATEAYRFGSQGTPIEISSTGRPGKGHVITAIPTANMTTSMCSGNKGLDTLHAQYAYHTNMGGRVEATMISVPLMSSRLPDPHQPRQPSTSTENLVFTENGVRRQTPGGYNRINDLLMTAPVISDRTSPPDSGSLPGNIVPPRSTKRGRAAQSPAPAPAPAQAHLQGQVIAPTMSVPLFSSSTPSLNLAVPANTGEVPFSKEGPRRQKPRRAPDQPPAPAPVQAQPQAQAHPQGQEVHVCANCYRPGHLIGDCVGPPNPIHGDLPACPNCNTFVGRSRIAADPGAHRFDDCPRVHAVFARLQRSMDRHIAYPDLAALTDDELLMFFRVLVVKRARKVPVRTKLVCWIDILRETARRFRNTDTVVLSKMTPWTKPFSIQQHNLDTPQAKPWEFYDYAVGNIQSLPMGPVEQVLVSLEDFVRDGLLGFPAQIFVSSDRK